MLSIDQLIDYFRTTLRQSKRSTYDVGILSEMALYRQRARQPNTSPKSAVLNLFAHAIQQIEAHDAQKAAILRARLIDGKTPTVVAKDLNISESDVFRKQRAAIGELAEILVHMEEMVVRERHLEFERRLSAPVHLSLFGIEEHLGKLQRSLLRKEEPWLLAIEGIGGIGKTALATSLLRRLIEAENYDGIAWVSALPTRLDAQGTLQPQSSPAQTIESILAQLYDQLLPNVPRPASLSEASGSAGLIRYLRGATCLIVIDNLETVDEVERLLPLLRQMMNPSKFILTSRKNFYGESELSHFSVPELSEENALRLIRHEAAVRQSMHLQIASDSELLPIYDLTGGNPLALHLVAGQLHVHPISTILDDLKMAQGQSVENLYTYIYANAWKLLSSEARRLLIFMPLTTHMGATIDELVSETKLERGTVRTALDQLLILNLVHSRLNQQRYAIHSLTRTFLLEQVIRWQKAETKTRQ